MIEGKIIQPLTLDVSAFKRRYNSLVHLSTFERANKRALEHKRLKWAAYRPLENMQLYDSLDEITATILSPFANHSSKRSTKSGVLYAQSTVVQRPTELLAIAHALGLYKFASDDPVVRQDPNRVMWYCIECETFKPLTEFAKDRHNVHGLAFACNRCRKENERKIYKRAA